MATERGDGASAIREKERRVKRNCQHIKHTLLPRPCAISGGRAVPTDRCPVKACDD